MNTLFLIGLAVLGGVAVTLQGQFMGIMEQNLGTKGSVFITYASGGLIAVLFALLRGANLENWRKVPWYAFSAGILGLIIVGTIGYVVPRLGVAGGFILIVASQFLLAALIDHFGWFQASLRPLDLPRLMGFGLMMLGVWLVVK
ncbi:MAG: DMT family transporter [Chloroflexi bacterium]|nr:DMT family transporter [Chloroflexota bacterium]